MNSLRARLIMGTGLATALLIGTASVTLYVLVRSTLSAEFDQLLAAKARAMAALVEQDKDGIEIEFVERPLVEFERVNRPEYFQLWLDDGHVLARSRHLLQSDLPRLSGEVGDPQFRSIHLPDGRAGRIAGITFDPPPAGQDQHASRRVTLVVAKDTAEVDETLLKLTWILATVAAMTTLLILVALAWVIHRNLTPVARLAREIDSIDEGQLSARFDLDEIPEELMPVVKRLNNLLTRLQAAFQREKAFTADAAHELRTPLAGLRTTLEVSLTRQRSPEAYRQAMEKCLGICEQTQSVVETLLALARLDAAPPSASIKVIHVASILRDCWGVWEESAQERSLDVQFQVDEFFRLPTDSGKFRIMIDNLFANVITYTNRSGSVFVEANTQAEVVTIRITNSGSQIDSHQLEDVFKPFWRGDKARSATGTHAGLGLSLCKRLADSIGARIAVDSAVGGDFSVCLQFLNQKSSLQSVSEPETNGARLFQQG